MEPWFHSWYRGRVETLDIIWLRLSPLHVPTPTVRRELLKYYFFQLEVEVQWEHPPAQAILHLVAATARQPIGTILHDLRPLLASLWLLPFTPLECPQVSDDDKMAMIVVLQWNPSPLRPVKVSLLEGWPRFMGEFVLESMLWDFSKWPEYRGWPHFRGPD